MIDFSAEHFFACLNIKLNILACLFLPCEKESLDSICSNAIISEDTNDAEKGQSA